MGEEFCKEAGKSAINGPNTSVNRSFNQQPGIYLFSKPKQALERLLATIPPHPRTEATRSLITFVAPQSVSRDVTSVVASLPLPILLPLPSFAWSSAMSNDPATTTSAATPEITSHHCPQCHPSITVTLFVDVGEAPVNPSRYPYSRHQPLCHYHWTSWTTWTTWISGEEGLHCLRVSSREADVTSHCDDRGEGSVRTAAGSHWRMQELPLPPGWPAEMSCRHHQILGGWGIVSMLTSTSCRGEWALDCSSNNGFTSRANQLLE